MDIILASGSPRRQELLKQMGIKNFRVVTPNVDESMEKPVGPGIMVVELSRRKARAVWEKEGDSPLIIAADTVVAQNGDILGKPHSRKEAGEMLRRLSGGVHAVYTGVTVLRGNQISTEQERTSVTFRPLSDTEISRYLDTGEPMDKAGAYGIQGVGALLIKRINGDYFNVMGLPVCLLGQMLKAFGVDALALAAEA